MKISMIKKSALLFAFVIAITATIPSGRLHNGWGITYQVSAEEISEPETPGETEEPETPSETEEPETPGETEGPETPGDEEEPETPGDEEEPDTPSGVIEETDAELLINYLTELAADLPYTDLELEVLRAYLENWFGLMDETDTQTYYDTYYMDNEAATTMLHEIMTKLDLIATDLEDYPMGFMSLASVAGDMPERLVEKLTKSAEPVGQAFREYEVSLSFKVGEQTFTEEGTVENLSFDGWKAKGGPDDADLYKYGVEPGNKNCFGIYLPAGKDYYVKINDEYVKVEPNAYWDYSNKDSDGNPTGSNCYVFIPSQSKPANVWFPGLVGTSFDKAVNDSYATTVIYSTLPKDTIYNTIRNVVITDALPEGFIYVDGSAKIDGLSDGISVEENPDGTITFTLDGDFVKRDDSSDPYTITYEMAAVRDDYLEGQKELELTCAGMTYEFENISPTLTSNGCDIDVPPLFEVALIVDKRAVWEGGDALLTPEIIVLGTAPPTDTSENGWRIPIDWLDYYNFENYAKIFTDSEGNENELDSLDEIPLADITGTGLKTFEFIAKMPVAYDPYHISSAMAELIVVKGELIVEMLVSNQTEREVTNGLFDVMVNYRETDTSNGGQFSFGADLSNSGHKDSRVYAVKQNALFNAAAYVPYGYQVAGIFNNGASFVLDDVMLESIDPSTYAVTKTIVIEVEKISKPWFRQWAWRKEEEEEEETR